MDSISLVSLLQQMVQIDSAWSIQRPTPELELQQFLANVARGRGLDITEIPIPGHVSNLLLKVERTPAAPWRLFVSHMDTVSAEGMTIAPFSGAVERGRMSGRGACDTKASGAAMLTALCRYAASTSGDTNVALLFTVNEENGMAGVQATVRDFGALGFQPASAVVGEPTQLNVGIAHNGSLRLRLSAAGVAAHSSDPSKGRSAISAMVRLIARIETEYVPQLSASHPRTGNAQCSVTMIHGGVQPNVIPSFCDATVDRRMVPGETTESVLQGLQAVIDTASRENPDDRLWLERGDQSLAFEIAEDHPLVCSARDATAGFGFGGIGGLPFGTEAGYLSAAGIPSIVLGPGSIEQAHTVDEWIDVEQVQLAEQVYYSLMIGR